MTPSGTVVQARSRRWFVAGFLAALVALPPLMAGAQTEAGTEAQALFREVMSPFCPGLTLADCPSQQAFEMRGDIERRLKNGESRQVIVDELVATYGAQVLADPSDTPIGRVVWGVPMILSALAAGALALFLRRVTRGRPGPGPADAEPTLSARTRLDEELAALD